MMELPPIRLREILIFLLLSTMDVPWLLGSAANFSNETDRRALLNFKHLIKEDPLHSLSSWNNTLHFCRWQGVRCSRRHPQRVTALNFAGQNLVGSISPYIANLTFLRIIDLSANYFHGTIPEEMGRLFRLREFNVTNNTFTGEIPENLTHCSELQVLDLFGNHLTGKILTNLGSLLKLNILSLGGNNLTGRIPPSLGNLSSLAILYLTTNSLVGSIPDNLGLLVNLRILGLALNKLSGSIPPSLYNLSSISIFDVGQNRLHGNLPPHLGLSFPNLRLLYAGGNQFTGPIPVSLPNASGLELIDLGTNNFSGPVLMNFGILQSLYWISFGTNQLGTGKAHDLNFLVSLTNCSNLQAVVMGNNLLSGLLPEAIANFSSQLETLWLENNMIFGNIPSGIQNLVGLRTLKLGYNFLKGTIPIGVGKLSKAGKVSFGGNELSGKIPSSLGNITQLIQLELYENSLSGSIPSSIGNCINLQFIYLDSNKFSGSLPKQLLSITSLIKLEAENNFFTGYLPSEAGDLKGLGRFVVSNNNFSGKIPIWLGNFHSLEYLMLDGNSFQGSIPPAFSALRGLQFLDLSRNNLSEKIPKFLEELDLKFLNLSFNNFEGELPKHGVFGNASQVSVLGNSKLCGGIQELHLPACSSQASKKRGMSLASKVKISVIGVVLCLISLSCLFIVLYRVRKSRRKPPTVPSLEDPFMNISYAELSKATDGFSSANLIGTGSFGSVYKGTLDRDGTVIAVKVLNLQQQGALKSFMAECEALRNIKHRNLIKILTCCSSIDFKGNEFKALVFEYMPNGSLDKWLHRDGNDQRRSNLNFIQRLNIAMDVACSLDYLHHHCPTTIVHRDLKPSNVLLDEDMTAHVGDFGLARFLSEAQTSSVGVKGSTGYIAPEYAMGGKASTQGDVYSYGILLLEMIIGKRPTDDMFEDNLSLHNFAKLALSERVMEIVDPILLEEAEVVQDNENHISTKNKISECLISIVKIGVLCSAESPRERMETKDIITKMHAIKDLYLEVEIHRNNQFRPQMLSEGQSYLTNY